MRPKKPDFSEEVAVLSERIRELAREKRRVIVAVDGRCAAGKSTLAAALQKELGCAVFHLDDYFLRPEQRTAERLAEPGGNVDRERFQGEVLDPLAKGESTVVFRPFDCSSMALADPVEVGVGRVAVVEGSYSCHPELIGAYDLRVFVDVTPEEQRRRILAGRPERAEAFFTRWIPMEEAYFDAFSVPDRCDIIIRT